MNRSFMPLLVAGCFYYSGLIRLVRWWRARDGKQFTILNYHRASVGDLRRRMLYLRRAYRVVHLQEGLEELFAPHAEGSRRDRRPLLALTFDDGYRDIYTHAFPLARELRVPITVFLIPGYIESARCFWWLEGQRLLERARVEKVTIEGRTYHLEREDEREALAQSIYDHARATASIAERESFLAAMREAMGVCEPGGFDEETALTWDEVREMEHSSWVSFGAHTMHHPVLSHLRDPAEVQYEVSVCRTVLEQQLGHAVPLFAYPLGRDEHIGAMAVQVVKEAGYAWAVTTMYGVNTPRSDPYLLRRIVSDDRAHWLISAATTCGLWQAFLAAYHRLRGRRE
jgi:peptidoglycan/xylan/chitin deacetylase (PgdA/CDA1 family)